jgi:hypothetical protein
MAKQIQGSCNRCGHCGCYEGAGGPAKWYPGIGAGSIRMRYYEDHPQIQPILFQLIKDEFAVQYDRAWEYTDTEFSLTAFEITGGGPKITADLYVSRRGIHVSATNFSCPWFQLGTPNICRLWGRTQLPPACANNPQAFQYLPNGETMIAAWEINHPNPPCGYSWIDV